MLRRLSSWCFAALLCLPVGTCASPAISDSVLHCVVLDEARWEATPVAGKQAVELNEGEPRTVRMIYFLPSDRPYRQTLVDSMTAMMVRMQHFYGEQMESHRHGYMTFRYEADADGAPVVHRVDGDHPRGYYNVYSLDRVGEEVFQEYHGRANNVLFIVLDHGYGSSVAYGRSFRAGGIGGGGKGGGVVLVPGSFRFSTCVHELAHAFGMGWHDFRDGDYVLSWSGKSRLSACSAAFLSVNVYFNADVPLDTDRDALPTFELLSPRRYEEGTERLTIRVRLFAPHGLHQLIAKVATPDFSYTEVVGCRLLSGEQEAVIEYEYDGAIPSAREGTLSDPPSHSIFFSAVDRRGDIGLTRFDFIQRSPYHLATLEGHTGQANRVAISPDGATLASGSSDETVKLWDTETREEIATLAMSGRDNVIPLSLAFSPDGSLLAAGTVSGEITLWDVATRRMAGRLEGHNRRVVTLAFSADGGTLVSGSSYEDTIKVWDVATRQILGVLRGHTNGVRQVAFSPDGRILASCSSDGTIRIWDLEALKERYRLVRIRGGPIRTIAFSPDGRILAADSIDNRLIVLWDWAAQRILAELPLVHEHWTNHLTFSPDGESLATAGAGGLLIVRDVATGRVRQRLPHLGAPVKLAYWPDGSVLAAGTIQNTVELWDTSERVRRRPDRVAVVSGQEQQGVAGKALPAPFVASVLDQDGDPFPGIPLLFTVTEGGGAVSATAARADTSGRAATTLTLGAKVGVHTVAAQAIDLAPAVFTATAYGSPDVDGDGAVDFRDFVVFAGKFGTSRGRTGYDARCDLDGDGTIGFSDFVIFAGAFGQTA